MKTLVMIASHCTAATLAGLAAKLAPHIADLNDAAIVALLLTTASILLGIYMKDDK